jgi:hypothetical protein
MLGFRPLRYITWAGCLGTTLLASPAKAQQEQVWTQFTKEVGGDYRFGYQDSTGRIRLPAKFGAFTNAQKFRHIMAVSDGRSLRQYYLLKNGRQVGRDSVYMFDFQVDCEQEGFIRFQSKHTKRVGFLNAHGQVAIPAQYNYVSPFYNGLAVALHGAHRACWGGTDTLHCEHLGWTGGREVVINQRNEVVIDQLLPARLGSGHLNFYSLQRNAPSVDTTTTVTLTAINGDRYTFTDYDREFKQWFFREFLPAVRSGPTAVRSLCYAELATAGRPFQGWQHLGSAAFVESHFQALHTQLADLQPDTKQLQIGAYHLNTLTFSSSQFAVFLTNCGEHFAAKHPVYSVLLNSKAVGHSSGFDHQWQYSFIRTAQGYQLYEASF